jgi:heme exporter protein B
MTTLNERTTQTVTSPRAHPRRGALSRYLGQVAALVWKDLVAERRTKEILSAMLVFGLLVVLIFNFAFDLQRIELNLIGPGILWVAFTFAGILGLNRAFALEKDRGALEGLMLAPMDRSAVYLGKLISTFILMTVMEATVLPVYGLLNNQGIQIALIPVILMGTLGFVAAGVVFAAVAVNTRTREVLLPILLFPILVPVIITAVGGTAIILRGGSAEELASPLSLLLTFDIVFLVVGFLVFEYVIEE